MRGKSTLALVGFLAAAFATATLGGLATASSVGSWYPTLAKPAWTPPSRLFGPVWSALFALMAVAAWRVWRKPDSADRAITLRLFFVQLVLNGAWSALFFGLRRPAWAIFDIVALLIVLVVLQFRFRRLDAVAGWLWLPYVAWVSFATALNTAVWWLNR